MALRNLIAGCLCWVSAVAAIAGSLPEEPRVVSADGAITEIIYALGMEDRLVGVDTTSRYPPATADLPKVGYLRALPFEGILALAPDILLTSGEAAPQITLDRLSRAGVRVVSLPVVRSTEGLTARILDVGSVLGAEEAAGLLAAEVSRQVRALTEASAVTDESPRVLFLLAAGNHNLMIAGDNTSAGALLSLVGARNAVTGVEGYKPASREAILASQPDAIVIAESSPGQFRIDDWQELSLLPAWQRGYRHMGDSMLLLGFGPRLPEAVVAVLQATLGEQIPGVAGHDR